MTTAVLPEVRIREFLEQAQRPILPANTKASNAVVSLLLLDEVVDALTNLRSEAMRFRALAEALSHNQIHIEGLSDDD